MATFPSDSVRTKNWGTEVLTDSDLEGQFDLIHEYLKAALNASTGHAHDGTSNNGPKLSPANLLIASQAQGDMLYASSSTVWARLAKGTAAQILAMNAGATAPEWKSYADYVTAANALAGSVVQTVNYQTGAYATGTTVIPNDDTIPQNTEGDQYMTLAITPKSATNKLKIDVVFNYEAGNLATCVALFQDTTAGALAAIQAYEGSSLMNPVSFTHYMTAGTTSETTFKVRAGQTGGNLYFNGINTTGRKLGGVLASSITITEIKV